jgi:hypothetical protein
LFDHTARPSPSNTWEDSATMRRWQVPEIEPNSATSRAIEATGATLHAPWQPKPNPRAGIDELAWFDDHQADLVRFAGRWIAIVGQEVISSGDTFDEAYDEASRLNYSDMLILPVPKSPGDDYYLIA